MVPVPPHHIADIRIYPFPEFRGIVPELPARSVHYHEKAEFVTGIHKGGILGIVCVPDDFHPGVTELFRVPVVEAVGQRIPYHGEILMTVGSHQLSIIRLPVQPEPFLALELYASDSYPLPVAVDRIALVVAHVYIRPGFR